MTARPIAALLLVILFGTGVGGRPAAGQDHGGRSVLSLADVLPAEFEYDPAVPTPRSILGFEVGEWHARPDQIVAYFRALAEASPRIAVEEYARSHEQRPLILAFATAPDRLAQRETLRRQHLAAIRGDGDAASPSPLIVWMGYGVHGNEASASNASLLVGYFLAAARGAWIDAYLERAITIVDPCLNPDGAGRFASWVNSHRGRQPVANSLDREHHEAWPGGRTNHYWFDLNRDWLLLVHPESRGRVREFHRWLPHLLTDFHEMGTNSTYFFQPGVPSRQNPRTPERNLELTRIIAGYHARALDARGQSYFTEERFDDFYYGKGSTYPDVHGSIGILFEQASARGHVQQSENGPLTFCRAIENQLITSISSLRAAWEQREELVRYQREFRRATREQAVGDPVRAYVFGDGGDYSRTVTCVELLRWHCIDVHALRSAVVVGGHAFQPGRSFAVPTRQAQYRLVKALFERRTEFEDDSFYDVSTWTLPLAYGLSCAELTSPEEFAAVADTPLEARPTRRRPARAEVEEGTVAVLLPWRESTAPRALTRILQTFDGVRVATRPFRAHTSTGVQPFSAGTVIAPWRDRRDPSARRLPPGDLSRIERRRQTIADVERLDGIELQLALSGLTPEGIDLGSPSARRIELPRPLLVVGSGVSATTAGAIWHLLDWRYGLAVTRAEARALSGADLSQTSHVILCGGAGASLPKEAKEHLSRWVRAGGVVVALRGDAHWVSRELLGSERVAASEEGNTVPRAEPSRSAPPDPHAAPGSSRSQPHAAAAGRSDAGDPAVSSPEERGKDQVTVARYADYPDQRARTRVSGAIFEAVIDPTHPLAFGLGRERIALFRTSTSVLEDDPNPYVTVARYGEKPLLSGFASPESIERIAGTPAICAQRLGRGVVIRIADDVAFRGYWRGTERILANAIFFGTEIQARPPLRRR